jgi:inosose dehydratase
VTGGGDRVAGAPISWGVCEVPGWGYQLPVDRVLGEMRELGLTATEFGPDGYLPAGPAERASVLAAHGLAAAGGFVPVVLHDKGRDPLPAIDRALDGFGPPDGAAHLGGERAAVLVLAAATGTDGYETRPELDAEAWTTLLVNLTRAAERATERGFTATLHPHVGTMVAKEDEVLRVLDGTDVRLCLDTGHLLIGGTDPAALAREAGGRVGHVHLKDVRRDVAARVTDGTISYADGVRAGLYQPLGRGDVDIAGVIAALRRARYQGWYVLEQDTILTAAPDESGGPVTEVHESLEYLRGLL